MLKIDRKAGKLTKLNQTKLSDADYGERSGLQELILGNPAAFFEYECNETLFLVKEEVEPSSNVGDRIDLLAIDAEGRAVIVELKRGSNKLQLLQSLTYAAMISDWDEAKFKEQVPPIHREAYGDFLATHDISVLNDFQRIILVAESFGFEILRTAQWLTDTGGLNITCYQITLAQDGNDGGEYLAAVQIFPPKELAVQARRRGAQKSEAGNKFVEIEELLKSLTNDEVKIL